MNVIAFIIDYLSMPLTVILVALVATVPDSDKQKKMNELVFVCVFSILTVVSQFIWS